ncbi:MAG: NADH-quinone oxidoreductase subunit 5 family protein [Propionibacteriaceae bacterium]
MSVSLSTLGSGLLWAAVGLPLVVGIALVLLRPRSRRLAWASTLGAASLTLLLTGVVARLRPEVQVPFVLDAVFGLRVDALAAIVTVTVAAVAVLVLVFAAADVTDSVARFGGLMLIFVAAVLVTVTATTLPTLLVAWEVMGATSYALIGFSYADLDRVGSGLVAFLTTRTADLGLYVAAGAALAAGHGLALADLATAPPGWRSVIAVGIAVSGLGKAAQLPFAFWLSRAMVGPSPVSALLHSAAMVAMGGFLLLRVPDLLSAAGWVGPAVAWAGALTTVGLGLVAIAQRDLKQVLAASTSAQLGFVVLAAGVGGVSAGTVQLVAHAATKALLFLVAGAWLAALGTKQLSALRGAARRWPSVGVAATIGLLALAGIAPLSLWASKEAVLTAASTTSVLLYGVGLLGAVLSAGYAGRVLSVLWEPQPIDDPGLDAEEPGTRRVGWAKRAPMVVLGVGAAGLGVLVLPSVLDRLTRALGGRVVPVPGVAELIVSAALALVVVLVVWRRPLPAPSWAQDWLHLEDLAQRGLVLPTLRLAELLARVDDRGLDRGVLALGRGTLALATRLARVDDRVLDAGVVALARVVRRAGHLARRPQTGQLHQYYLQSAALLVAVAVVLVLIG